MCASRNAQAGALGWAALVVGAYVLLGSRYADQIPDWAGTPLLVLVALLVVAGAMAAKLWDALRWRHLARSFGFERLGNAAAETPYSVLEGYRGQYEGRTAVLDFHDAQDSTVLDRTVVAAEHDGTPEATIIIEREGAGGTGSSDLPPEVDITSDSFSERFTVHSPASGFARAVVTTGVQDAIEKLENPIDIVVESERVRAWTRGRVLDADAAEEYLRAVCRLAVEVEARG